MAHSWVQPICDSCWWAGPGFGMLGPVRLKDPEEETCSYCDMNTKSGIYIRDDPKNVPFPQSKEK